ncbi:MAG: HD domain-containing protein, partial [Desulfovibrio sp.]|nr:HD domain-containing protein [Desulfovibrio sp.]
MHADATPSSAIAASQDQTEDRSRLGQPAPQVRKSLLQLIFSGAYLLRWNDKNRARDLLEIDKQAHKMLAACMLWDRASRGRSQKERIELAWLVIEGGIFDYFFRLVVTDIKPPIFYKIKDRPDQYSHLVQHVFSELKPVLAPMQDFWLRFQDWHLHEDRHAEARNLLKAAHLFASRWEFKLIEPLNLFDPEMPDINRKFQEDLDALRPLVAGLDSLLDSESPLGRFASFCGQLRFQVRWTQAPRIPQTDVLGHMFIVAAYAYLFSLSIGACRARCVNNFFTGLLHDLPELLTRDIISPV